MKRRHDLRTQRRRQGGVATLVVVMLLFFVMSLVAAYTNRNLIFEQRTSANQYRSTQALEAAEAGLEWTVSMLNYGRISTACSPSTTLTDTSFRGRYLNIDDATGTVAVVANPAGGELTPTCVWNGTGWTCSCPLTGDAVPAALPAATVTAPAFRLRFRPVSITPGLGVRQPGLVWLDVVGCTRYEAALGAQCLGFDGRGALNEGRVMVSQMVALTASAVGTPQAALTARGSVALASSGQVIAYNTAPEASGLTVHAGGAINTAGLSLHSRPGSPAAASIVQNDAMLNLPQLPPSPQPALFTATDRMFANVFNLRPTTFRQQQAAVELDCAAGCTAAEVRTAVSLNPGRPLWLTGGLTIDSSGDIGTAAEPVLLVINGDLRFDVSGVTVHGLVYSRLPLTGSTAGWVTGGAGSGRIEGAVVAEGDVSGTGTTTIVYDRDVLRRVRQSVGSFVRVPGSWRDFQ